MRLMAALAAADGSGCPQRGWSQVLPLARECVYALRTSHVTKDLFRNCCQLLPDVLPNEKRGAYTYVYGAWQHWRGGGAHV
jgi:hypothetical protein